MEVSSFIQLQFVCEFEKEYPNHHLIISRISAISVSKESRLILSWIPAESLQNFYTILKSGWTIIKYELIQTTIGLIHAVWFTINPDYSQTFTFSRDLLVFGSPCIKRVVMHRSSLLGKRRIGLEIHKTTFVWAPYLHVHLTA